jgi:WS/DGAT/MGAT family acyltransferase
MEMPEERWDPDEPSPELLFIRAASERIRRPMRNARKAARGALTMPKSTAQRVRRTAEGFAGLAAGGPSAPRMSINVEIGRDRRAGFVATTLQTLKDARGDGGATVNDVILSVTTGALREFLERRGDDVPASMVALVPMSIRQPEEQHDLGNRIATLMVELPLAERDPNRRLELIHAETARVKQSAEADAASLVIEATGWAPPTINRALSMAISRPLTWNMVISNVPGPQIPIYLLGRKMREVYPFVPLSPQGHALSVGVVSYDGGVFFGLAGDRDELADIDDLAAALEHAIAEHTA